MSELINLMDKWLGIEPVNMGDETVMENDLSGNSMVFTKFKVETIVFTKYTKEPDKFELNCMRCTKLLTVLSEPYCREYDDSCKRALLICDGRK